MTAKFWEIGCSLYWEHVVKDWRIIATLVIIKMRQPSHQPKISCEKKIFEVPQHGSNFAYVANLRLMLLRK